MNETQNKMPYFFETPTQVKFLDDAEDELKYKGGIAYGDVIVCGCCGGVVEISDLLECFSEQEANLIIIPLEWIDISEAIIGE
jgi:hypothetical protein